MSMMSPTTTRCAFLGLGVMGAPMARHLSAAGYEVQVWNRSFAKATTWADANAGTAATLEHAVAQADIVLMCLGDDPDVREVFENAAPHLKSGAIVIDHTTGSAELARELANACVSKGVSFLDAPVSGGQAGAENGQLTVMVGGDEEAFKRAEPVIQSFAKQISHIGPTGHGQLAKSVNQICIAGIVQGLAEGLHFASEAGLDETKVIEAISKGAAQSWQMDNRWETMVAGNYKFGFAVDWMRKDLRIALAAARDSGARLPLTALVDQFYADVQAEGGGRMDTSSLKLRLEPTTKRAGQ